MSGRRVSMSGRRLCGSGGGGGAKINGGGGGWRGGGTSGRSFSSQDGSRSGRSFSSHGGGKRGGGSSGRSFSGSDGNNHGGASSQGGGRGSSEGGGRFFSAGSRKSVGGRVNGSIYVGGRADGSHSGGGRISGHSGRGTCKGKVTGKGSGRGSGSVPGRESGRDYRPHSCSDDTYDASSEDSDEENDQFDDDDGSYNNEANGHDGNGTETDDGDDIYYSKRGYSLGIYAKVPEIPHPIRMVKKVIDNPTASRTLLALTRIYWPVGCIGTKDIDRKCPRWWRFMRKKFFMYYTYDSRYGTEQDARRAVSFHMRENMRKAQASERKRVQKVIKENGGSFLDHRPPYLSEPVWEVFCKYWDSPEFQKRSAAAKENRKKQATRHKSGAKSFRRRAWDILEKTGEEPGEFDLFVNVYTDEAGVYTSEAVGAIVERYINLCQKQNINPSQAPISTWAKAVGVRKNAIIGVPRTKASDIIPIERSRKRRRGREDDESGASTNGRPVIHHMADDFVIKTVDQTVGYARTHPEEFGLAPEQVDMLAQSVSVADGEGELPLDHPLSMSTMTELVQVMVSVLADIKARQIADCDKGKGKSTMHNGDCSSSDSDIHHQTR